VDRVDDPVVNVLRSLEGKTAQDRLDAVAYDFVRREEGILEGQVARRDGLAIGLQAE